MIDREIFSRRLKELRTAKGFTATSLGRALGITQQSVFTWETMKTVPSADKLVELAELLECSLDHLCGIDGSGLIPAPSRRTDPDGGAIIFEYEKNGEKATLRFPRNATAGEIQDKINEFLPLPSGRSHTGERERK